MSVIIAANPKIKKNESFIRFLSGHIELYSTVT